VPKLAVEKKEASREQLYDFWDCGLAGRIDARSPRGVLAAIITAVGDHVTEEADLCRVLIEARTQAAYVGAVAERVRSSDADALARMTQLVEAGIVKGEWPVDTNRSSTPDLSWRRSTG
jgi:hypothetical protein